VRSLARDSRFQAEEAPALIKAISQLVRGISEEGVQYREVVTDCMHALASAFPGQCTPEVKDAVQARLAKLQAEKDPESEGEVASLLQCLAAFDGGAAAPSAA